MAIDNQEVPRETPPLGEKGPILEIDMDVLEDRLKRLGDKDRQRLLNMLDQYAVMIKAKK